jgi:hypothetical protein
MDLETVSKLVVAHSSPEKLKLERSLTEKASRQRMYQSFKWGMICFLLGMASLATVKTLSLDKTAKLGPLFLLFIGMGIMFYGLLSAMRGSTSQSSRVLDAGGTGELHEAGATKELTSARLPVSVPSITERTTQLLATEDVDKPRE